MPGARAAHQCCVGTQLPGQQPDGFRYTALMGCAIHLEFMAG
ncbi:MAG TPA: hypothetical protein VLC91_03515 [Spongiibacteraceae bacterium]|nr:hypothetical protein [Spongiibacteraceae bacterium]